MEILSKMLSHTPVWVFFLFAYLISRGLRGLRPATVSLPKLAIIPALLTVWSLVELVRLFGLGIENIGIWLCATIVGLVVGTLLLRRQAISADPQTGVIHRPRDLTLLPLLLLVFASKYAFAAAAAMSPELHANALYRACDIGLSGLFTGIFIGKFLVYLRVYLRVTGRIKPAGI